MHCWSSSSWCSSSEKQILQMNRVFGFGMTCSTAGADQQHAMLERRQVAQRRGQQLLS